MLFNGIFFGVYVSSVYKNVALAYLDDYTLTLAGSIGAIANGSSRLFWAYLMDYLGFKKVYACILVIQFVASIFMYSARRSPTIYTILVFSAFFCEGGHISTFPAQGVRMYGLKHGGKIFSFIFFAIPLSSMLGFYLAQDH